MKKQYTSSWWVCVALVAVAGCKIGAGLGVSSPGGSFAGPSSAGAGGGPAARPGAAAPGCDTPADHCLQPDDLLVSEPFKSGYVSAQVGKQTAAPNSGGEATFMVLADGSTKTSRTGYRSHRAAPAELAVGALVAALDVAGDGGTYRAPTTRQEAIGSNWFVSRIVSVDPVPQGHVIVSGGYRVALDALRIVDGDDHPRLTAAGAEDATFVKPDHWVVGSSALPASGYISARLALAIQAPSPATRGDGEFLIVSNGERLWSKHAWRTRLATAADLKLGAHVVALDVAGSQGVYRAPESRHEALHSAWFIAKITDVGELYKGVVTVSGNYRVAVNGLRVLTK